MLEECKDFQRKICKTHRFFVPDLAPWDRPSFLKLKPKWIFVAESPHVNEVEPSLLKDRRPLCGMAGRKWWGLLSELWGGAVDTELSAHSLEQFCLAHRMWVMNAVQLPLDPKIALHFEAANPIRTLGFLKGTGEFSYKRLRKAANVQSALTSLRQRLMSPQGRSVPVICLGNDAQWWVNQALLSNGNPAHPILSALQQQVQEKIPHPSAWWRKGGYYGRVARERLEQLVKLGQN